MSVPYPVNGYAANTGDRRWESELLTEENLGDTLEEAVDEIEKYFNQAASIVTASAEKDSKDATELAPEENSSGRLKMTIKREKDETYVAEKKAESDATKPDTVESSQEKME